MSYDKYLRELQTILKVRKYIDLFALHVIGVGKVGAVGTIAPTLFGLRSVFSVRISAYNDGFSVVDYNLCVVPRSPRSFLPSGSLALFQTIQILRRLAIMHFIFAQILLSLRSFVHHALRWVRGRGFNSLRVRPIIQTINLLPTPIHVNYDCLLHTSYVLVGQITFSLHAWSLILSSINHVPHTCMYMYYYISLYLIQLEWAAFIYPSHM